AMPAEGADEGGSSGERISLITAFPNYLKKNKKSANQIVCFLNSEKKVQRYFYLKRSRQC
ncbi:MAG TPA: hypothetical protein H9742_03440, partial [Candidatus Acetatifactor stercoripullorum]|nr:hypothetical protein [Candidatus Acetatifactor stercoripullorum]